MKKLIAFLIAAFFALSSYAQVPDYLLPIEFPDPLGCNIPVVENGIPLMVVSTIIEDCSAGSCDYFKDFGQLWMWAARLSGDLSIIPVIHRIELDVHDNCGTGCTMAFLYDFVGLPIATASNTGVGIETLTLQPTTAQACSEFAVSSCEGAVLEVRIYMTGTTPLSIDGDVTYAGAPGECFGEIDLSISGGTPPYSILWSNTAVSEDLTSLCPGTYSVTVTDANNYNVDSFFDVFFDIELNPTLTHPTGAGLCDGAITITPTGGLPPYTYIWGDGWIFPNPTGLCEGTYNVTVTDATGYQVDSFFDIFFQSVNPPSTILPLDFPDPLGCNIPVIENGVQLTIVPTTAEDCTAGACSFAKDPGQLWLWPGRLVGDLSLMPPIEKVEIDIVDYCGIGCTMAYLYDMSGMIIASDMNAATGSQTLILMPSSPIQASQFAVSSCEGVITEVRIYTGLPQLSIQGVVSNASSASSCDGSVALTVMNGTPPYSFLWSNQSTMPDLMGVCPGTYSVTVIDAVGEMADSFFDVYFEISITGACCLPDGSCIAASESDCAAAGGTFEGLGTDCATVNCWSNTNDFSLALDQQGFPLTGGGSAYFDDPSYPSDFSGWYYYPNTNWWNIWFYDHPFDPSKHKIITIEFDLAYVNPGAPAYLDFAVNWSTPQWDPPLVDVPPLPTLVGPNEALYIMRPTLQLWNGSLEAGHHEFCYVIPDYCPEWVSIDVQGFNFNITNGIITHECVDAAPPSEGRCCYPDPTGVLICDENYECECTLLGGQWNPLLDCTTPCATVLGACCLQDNTCVEVEQNICSVLGGVYQGDNTTCSTTICSPIGRCCIPDPTGSPSSCMDITQQECLQMSGFWDATLDCTNNPCITSIGACCYTDGTCQDMDQASCLQNGGIYQGDATSCNSITCSPSIDGACCMPDGTCIDLDAVTCLQSGGNFQGIGTLCAQANCPPATESCCMPDATCQDLTPADCANAGGVSGGIGTSCTSTVCPTIGACCLPNDACQNTTETQCLGLGGLYMGDGTDCATNPCPQENLFWITVNEAGLIDPDPLNSGGTEFFPSGTNGWVEYPSEWFNIWFYDHPFDDTRWKEIHVTFTVAAFNPQLPSEFIFAINWATPEWSLGPNATTGPPIPIFTPTLADEALYIERPALININGMLPTQFYDLCLYIPNYNPEWVSIDVMGSNFVIDNGYMYHACLPGPPPMIGSVSSSVIEICEGDCATPTALGGFTYEWSTGATTQGISVCPIANTTYTVTISDINGCMIIETVDVIVHPNPSVTLDCYDITCFGYNDGSINANASGGSPGYSFQWSNGGSGSTISGLPPATYTVTVTDAFGCTATASCNINEPSAITFPYISLVTPTCYGDQDGAISVTVNGGTPGYTYAWSSGAITQHLIGIGAGTYTLTVTDANGCTETATITLTEPSALNLSLVCKDITCFGDNDGSIVSNISGGTAGYSYSWTGGSTGSMLLGLAPGTYTVTATDARGCTATASCTISEPPLLTVNLTCTDISCHGYMDGTISVGASGGTGTLSYNWSSGHTTGTINNLGAGIYSVTVTDANGCTASASCNIIDPPLLVVSLICTDVSCYGYNDGQILALTSGGTATLTYSWTPAGNFGTSLTGLAPGYYTIHVVDANGCTATASCTINEPPAININIQCTDASCYSYLDGSVVASANGGTGALNYSWSVPGVGGTTLNNVGAGTYTVTVTDSQGCTETASCTVNEPPLLSITAICFDISSSGANDGSVSTITNGGTPPYAYNWSIGNFNVPTINNLGPGVYTVTVTDANGCTASHSCTIFGGSTLNVIVACTPVSCYGYQDGSVLATPVGGVAPFSYAWSPGIGTAAFQSNLVAGTYVVTVTDGSGASAVGSCTVGSPAQVAISLNCSNILCQGDQDGAIVASVSGAINPVVYSWSSGQTTSTISNLAPGTYTLTVTDNNACTATAQCTLTEPSALSLSVTTFDVLCHGDADGMANAIVNGGIAPYTYWWGGIQGGSTLTGLPAGSYSINVYDNNGCNAQATFTINEPAPLLLNLNVTDVSCFGFADGSITSSVSGGTAPYAYQWSTGGIGTSISGLTIGNYTLLITDANGCTATATATVSQPADLVVAVNTTSVSCAGGSDGSATATVNGGTSPYVYLWNGIAGGTTNSNLTAGAYSLVVTDANGCQFQINYNIVEPPLLIITLTGTNVLCFGDLTGAITSTIAGGTTPYSLLWNTGSNLSTISGLAAGTYSLTVSDFNGCTLMATHTINQPPQLQLGTTGVNPSTTTSNDGSVDLTVNGGTSPYSYAWSTGATSEDINGLAAGNYCVTVTDANGCTAIACQLLTVQVCPNTNAFWLAMDPLGMPAPVPQLTGGQDYYPGGLNGWYDYPSGWWNIWFCNLPYNPNAVKEVEISFDLIINQPGYIKFALNWSRPAWDTLGFAMPPLPNDPLVAQNENLYIERAVLLETDNVSVGNGSHTFTFTIPYCPAWVSIDIQGFGFQLTNGVIHHECLPDLLGQCCYIEPGAAVQCDMLTESDCNLLSGVWDANATCNDPCLLTAPWTDPVNTGNNHSISIPLSSTIEINGVAPSIGDEIGVFYDDGGVDVCGGSIVWNNTSSVLTAWGDDQQSPAKDGFYVGETFKWKIWDASEGIEYVATAIYDQTFANQGNYSVNGLSGILSLMATSCQDINIPLGWSLVSTYIDPDMPNMIDVWSDIVNDVVIVKNESGQVYWPAISTTLNIIGDWVVGEGYQVNMSTPNTLTVCGTMIDPAVTPIFMPGGWGLFAYLCQTPQATEPILAGILSDIIIVKNGAGEVYWPPFVNQIATLNPGEGYQAKMSNSNSFYYQCTNPSVKLSMQMQPSYYKRNANTGNNMTIGLPASLIEPLLQVGDEIGVFGESNQLVGSSVYESGFVAISAWGNDEYSLNTDGLQTDEEFIIRIWHPTSQTEELLQINSWAEGNSTYEVNGIAMAEKAALIGNNEAYLLYQNIPNPFRDETQIKFYVPKATFIELDVFNILGDKVAKLTADNYEQGIHAINFDSSTLPAGTYFYRIKAPNYSNTKRMNLIK